LRLDLVKAWSCGAQQALPLGRRDGTRAKPFLKSTDSEAQGRLRNTKLRCRPGEATFRRDSEMMSVYV